MRVESMGEKNYIYVLVCLCGRLCEVASVFFPPFFCVTGPYVVERDTANG